MKNGKMSPPSVTLTTTRPPLRCGQSRGTENTTLSTRHLHRLMRLLVPARAYYHQFLQHGDVYRPVADLQRVDAGSRTIHWTCVYQWRWTFAMPALTPLKTGTVGAGLPRSWLLAQQWKVRRCRGKSINPVNSTIAPNFQAGLNLNHAPVPFRPTTTIKKRAVLTESAQRQAVTNSDLNSVLARREQNAYPSSRNELRVYFALYRGSQGKAHIRRGGIYVKVMPMSRAVNQRHSSSNLHHYAKME